MSIKKIKEFFIPRFTISELENSQTRCGCDYEIDTIVFDDELPCMPKLAKGKIIIARKIKFTAMWSKDGKCTVNGDRVKSFDLIRPEYKKSEVVRPLIAGIPGIIIFLTLQFL